MPNIKINKIVNVLLALSIVVGTATASIVDVYVSGKPAAITAATTPPASTQTLKAAGVDPAVIKSVLMSPIEGQKTLNSVAGITPDTVTFGDLAKLVALDLSTISNPDLGTLLKRTNDKETENKQFLYNTVTPSSGQFGIWSDDPNTMKVSTFGKNTMQVIFAAKNITAIAFNGLFEATTKNLNDYYNFFTALGQQSNLGDDNLFGAIVANDKKIDVIDISNNNLDLTTQSIVQGLGLMNWQASSKALVTNDAQLYFSGNKGANTLGLGGNGTNQNIDSKLVSSVDASTQLLPPAFSLTGGAVAVDSKIIKAINDAGGDLSKLPADIIDCMNEAIVASDPHAKPVIGKDNDSASSSSTASSSSSSASSSSSTASSSSSSASSSVASSSSSAASSSSSVASSSSASASSSSSTASTSSSTAGGSTGIGSDTAPSGNGNNGTTSGLFDQSTLGVGKLQASNDPTAQLLPNGVKATDTLKGWGLPDVFINAIINNSQTFDGHHLVDFGRTLANVTFGDLMFITKLDLSDRNNTNGIQKWITQQPIYLMSVDNPDDWKTKTTFGAGNRQYTAGLWAIIMATTTVTSVDISGWMPALKAEDSTWTRAFGNLDLRKLPRLKQFSMAFNSIGNNAFSGELLPVFQNATLTTLDISGNLFTQLSGTSDAARISAGYPKLVNLNMSDMPYMNTFPTELKGASSPLAKRLQSLNIDRDNFTELPAWITTAAQNGLIILTATGNNLTKADTQLLKKPSTLEFMDLTGQDSTNNMMGSFYLDNSGTQAIAEYNKIINDPQMQIWLANDPTGPLASQMAAMREQIEKRQEYQAALNDYTLLLQGVELKANEMVVTVTVTVTTSIVINGQTYTVKIPFDATKDYDDPAVKAEVKTAALAQLKAEHPELVNLTEKQLEVSSIVQPLTNGELLDYFERHAHDVALTGENAVNTANAVAKLSALDPKGIASYDYLPAAPRPSDYGSDIPSYYEMEGSVVNTMKENIVADAQITIAKIQQVQDVLQAAGDKAGVANLQNQIDNINEILKNIPKMADAATESDFFYVRSMTKAFDDASSIATTLAVEKTISQLADPATKQILTQAAADGKISQDDANQMLAAGVDLLQQAKDIIQNSADRGKFNQTEADKLKNGNSVSEIVANIKDAMTNIDDQGRSELAAATGNDLLTSIGAAVTSGSTGFATDLVGAVTSAVVESVAQAIAAATGVSVDEARDQIKDKVITNAADVAAVLEANGAATLHADGSKDTSKTVGDMVNTGQGAITNGDSSAPTKDNASTSAPNTDNPGKPTSEPGDANGSDSGDSSSATTNNGSNAGKPDKPTHNFLGAVFTGVTDSIQGVAHKISAKLYHKPVSLTGAPTATGIRVETADDAPKSQRNNYRITAAMGPIEVKNTATTDITANVAYPGVQLIMANSDDSLNELTDFRPLGNSTSNAQGFNQKNAVVLGNDIATTDVAAGFADTDDGNAAINFNQVFLDFSATSKTIQAGDYQADIDWTITSGTSNDGMFR